MEPMRQDRYNLTEPAGWNTGAPLNLMKRLAFIEQHADIKGKRVIDCGCGNGEYVIALNERGARAWGIEYSGEKVAQYGQRTETPGRVMAGTIERICFRSGSFDIALLNEVLEHVSDERGGLREIYRVLRPDGLLVLFAPNRLHPFEGHEVLWARSRRRLRYGIPFVPYIPLWVGDRVFTYRARNYWPHDLRQRVSECGFKIIHTDYMWQTFENISGRQPAVVRELRGVFRRMALVFEATPLIRRFGVSQIIVAVKSGSSG
jgi:SAM-dependent methyltransferase